MIVSQLALQLPSRLSQQQTQANEKDELAAAAEAAAARATQLEAEVAESTRAHATATAELQAMRSAFETREGEIAALKTQIADLEEAAVAASNTSTTSTGTTAEEAVLELQQELEFQRTVIAENEGMVKSLKAAVAVAEERAATTEQNVVRAKENFAQERDALQASVDAWTRKYATHKARALEQYVCSGGVVLIMYVFSGLRAWVDVCGSLFLV